MLECLSEPEQPPATPAAELLREFLCHHLGSVLAGEGNVQLVLGKPQLSWRNVVSWDLYFPSSWEEREGGIQEQGIGCYQKSQEPGG